MVKQAASRYCRACKSRMKAIYKCCPECGTPRHARAAVVSQVPHHDDGTRLFEIAKSLSSTLDLDVLLRKIGAAAERLTDSVASSTLLLSEDKKQLYFKVASGQKGQFLKKVTVSLDTGIAGCVARTWKPLVVNDVSSDDRFTGQVDRQSGFVTKSVLAVPMVLSGELIGVCEVLNKKSGMFNDQDLATLTNLSGLAAVAILNARLVQDQRNFFSNMLEVLTSAVESQNPKFVGHSSRVAELSCVIGKRMNLKEDEYRTLYYGALLHHVGIIVLNNEMILLRSGASSQDLANEHLYPVLGAQLLCGIKLLSGAISFIRHHREYYDGTGYPDHLKGECIPLGARIICLAEHIEILRMWGLRGEELETQAQRMAIEGSGTRFDPKVVKAYIDISEKSIQVSK